MSSNKKKTGVKSIVSPGNFIMVSVDGETYNVTRDDKRFAKIEALVKRKEWDKVFSILGAVRDITMFSEGNIKVEGDPNQPLTSEVYHVTGEEQSKAIKKPAKVEKYVAVSAGPLRGPDGRFLKKKAIAKTKGPVRDSSGRFLKKDKMVTVALPPPVPVPAPVEDDIDEYDEYESDLDGRW